MAEVKRNANSSRLSLFDVGARDLSYRRVHGTSAFDDLNLSPDPAAAEARKVLDEWYSQIPPTKQDDLRGRFRKDDRQHSGGLLELVTHELARRLCDRVIMDPSVDGKTPDFLALYHGTEFFAECTVAQESDKEFGALRREQDVLDIIENVNSGPYALFLEPQRTGSASVPKKLLTTFLENRLHSLNEGKRPDATQIGTFLPEKLEWAWQDWLLHFTPVIVGDGHSGRTIVGRYKGLFLVRDASIIGRALEKKADAYPHLNNPYLVVATQREGTGDEGDLFEALLGREVWDVMVGMPGTPAISRYTLDGFFGSSDSPRNSHVSAVLYKRNLRDAWAIQNRWTQYDPDTSSTFRKPDWTLIHHPAAKYPLPIGMFPFATEYVWESGWTKAIQATRTVNDVLGLPDPWPD